MFDFDVCSSIAKKALKQEGQRVKMLLAHPENQNYLHAKLAKFLNVTKSTVIIVIKMCGKRLLTARKFESGENRKPEDA